MFELKREEAELLIRSKVENENLVKHMLATEAIMRALARLFYQDEELWGLAGITHDIDLGVTQGDMKIHGIVGAEMLRDEGFPDEIVEAVKAHAGHAPRNTLLEKALYAVDPLTGLIVASALIHPDKKLSAIDVQFLENRFKEKLFAKGANRSQIRTCEDLNLTLRDFMATGLEAMKEIADRLGL